MARIFNYVLAAGIFSATACAYGGAYSDAVAKQSRCEAAGELAMSFHGKTTQELRAAATDLDKQVRAKKIKKAFAEETKYILFMGKTAKSTKDAYMQTWAWCMDQK